MAGDFSIIIYPDKLEIRINPATTHSLPASERSKNKINQQLHAIKNGLCVNLFAIYVLEDLILYHIQLLPIKTPLKDIGLQDGKWLHCHIAEHWKITLLLNLDL